VALGLNQVSLSESTIGERLFHSEVLLSGGSATGVLITDVCLECFRF
jgi:hypothetical protein